MGYFEMTVVNKTYYIHEKSLSLPPYRRAMKINNSRISEWLWPLTFILFWSAKVDAYMYIPGIVRCLYDEWFKVVRVSIEV